MDVSQEELENEFYMVDIPNLLEKKRKEEKADYHMQLLLHIAANSRALKDEGYEEFVRNLTKDFEKKQENNANKLDRQALETLRFMTNQGANRTGGR